MVLTCIEKLLHQWKPDSKRKRDRSKTMWKHNMVTEARQKGLRVEDLEKRQL